MPAFFYQKSPRDSRPEWGAGKYPRADFTVDTRQDPERNAAGTLTANIWVTTECPPIGEQDPDRAIEERLIDLMSGTFFQSRDMGTVCISWDRSWPFDYEGGNSLQDTVPEVFGVTATFDLLAFPEQATFSPDPIAGLNAWTRLNFPGMRIIGYDRMEDAWKPTDENPAIYWRFEGTASTARQSYAVTWYDGTFAAHIIAGTVQERNRWTKAIIERAQADGEVILDDESPMFIQRIEIHHGADELREGQMKLIGRYGALSSAMRERAAQPINNLIEEREGGPISWMKPGTP